MAVTLLVCTTCRRGLPVAEGEACPGARLHAALAAAAPAGVAVAGIECLSACTQGCAVALSAPGRWSYVYGRIDPEADVAAVVAGAAAYARAPDGIVPWRERPAIFRKQSLARLPPLAAGAPPAPATGAPR